MIRINNIDICNQKANLMNKPTGTKMEILLNVFVYISNSFVYCTQDRPDMCPLSSTSMSKKHGRVGRPGIVEMVPHSGNTNPAPTLKLQQTGQQNKFQVSNGVYRTSIMGKTNPEGAPSKLASCENDKCDLACAKIIKKPRKFSGLSIPCKWANFGSPNAHIRSIFSVKFRWN